MPHLSQRLIPRAECDQIPGEIVDECVGVWRVNVAQQVDRRALERRPEDAIPHRCIRDTRAVEVGCPSDHRSDLLVSMSQQDVTGHLCSHLAFAAGGGGRHFLVHWGHHWPVHVKVVRVHQLRVRLGRGLDDVGCDGRELLGPVRIRSIRAVIDHCCSFAGSLDFGSLGCVGVDPLQFFRRIVPRSAHSPNLQAPSLQCAHDGGAQSTACTDHYMDSVAPGHGARNSWLAAWVASVSKAAPCVPVPC